MSKVQKPRRRGNGKKKDTPRYVFRHANISAVAFVAGRTRLPLEVADDALVALTHFDDRWSVADRELVQHLLEHTELDQLSAHRLVRALRFWHGVELQAFMELHGHQPDGGA